ncbi:MAG: TRL-like family protein [Deltaproteobacteria bacterium]|nr:MAG: TRL-like family protein [Deltaproteobacteria bacterium]
MSKTAALLAVFLLTLGVGGCVAAPVVPPLGMVYSDFDAPLGLGGGEVGSRRGESSVVAVLGLVSTGDASVRGAARAGGITEVKRVDYEFYNFLGLYQRFTTVVYGD